MKLQPGTFLQGDRYRIIDVLGQGGFGITYLAEQVMAERKVCIKEFFPKEYYKRDENSRSISLGTEGSAEIMEVYKAKFIKEAKTIARLDHPNIIHIFDVFAENNTAYYVMEYIDGESLSSFVRERGALAEVDAINYIHAVADALGYIHERKIMHLDIKPANIMLRKEDGRVIVIDFGLSKQYDADGNQTSSTPVGISAGYAPMEQYQQGGVREFSPETDIYSLGATLYYLVTGNVPPQAAVVIDSGLPELPAHLSNSVSNAIERSMEIQRRRRPHSIKEFIEMLECRSAKANSIQSPVNISEETAIASNTIVVDDKTVICGNVPNHYSHNHYEWVDLGVSVKWATCNVGADVPEQSGNHYAWGEINVKSSYTEDNCETSNKNIPDISGNKSYDVAFVIMGDGWRMPTLAEFDELIESCDWHWVSQNGVKGYKVTSRINGNSIFIPAAGCGYGEELYNTGTNGHYWSSTSDNMDDAYALYFSFNHHYTHKYSRYRGRHIRPVCDK